LEFLMRDGGARGLNNHGEIRGEGRLGRGGKRLSRYMESLRRGPDFQGLGGLQLKRINHV